MVMKKMSKIKIPLTTEKTLTPTISEFVKDFNIIKHKINTIVSNAERNAFFVFGCVIG